MRSLTLSGAALALLLAACSQQPAAPPAGTPPAGEAPGNAATDATAPAASAAGGTVAASESDKVDAATTAEESHLEKAAPLAKAGQLPAGKWIPGTHYRMLVPAQPTDAAPGHVEVVEMFWYGCPHCFAFDPFLEAWRKTKPAYVDFRRVPITWSEIHRMHARLYYTLEALGKEEQLHAEVFNEMNVRRNFMYAQGDERETLSAMTAFAKAHGIGESDFANAWNSFTVQTNLQKADDLVHRYKVEGVPLVVVNGKYVTDVNMAGAGKNSDLGASHNALISLINDLAASEKGH
jgi:thiol:disulfide interchange protein DsbA